MLTFEGFVEKPLFADQEGSSCCKSEFETTPASSNGGGCDAHGYDGTFACDAMYNTQADCTAYGLNQVPPGQSRCENISGESIWVNAACQNNSDINSWCYSSTPGTPNKKTHKFSKSCVGSYVARNGDNPAQCNCSCNPAITTAEVNNATVTVCANGNGAQVCP
jgi:hypothetical protein